MTQTNQKIPPAPPKAISENMTRSALTTQPRIPYPDKSALNPETLAELAKLPDLNIYKMLSHSEQLIKPFVSYGLAFRNHNLLDPLIREVAILRVGYLDKARYETTHHSETALSLGIAPELIKKVEVGPTAEGLTDEQREVLAFVDDVVVHVRASDATFNPIIKRYGAAKTQELTLLVGFYLMVTRFLETFDVPLEDSIK